MYYVIAGDTLTTRWLDLVNEVEKVENKGTTKWLRLGKD